MRYTLALAQMDSGGQVEENLNKIEKFVEEAAVRGASLVAFPEYSPYVGKDYAGIAQRLDGGIARHFADCAAKNHIYVHCGSMAERTGDARPCNTSLLFDPAGRLLAKYSKLHMFDISLRDGTGYRESDEASPGSEIVLCDTELGRFGMAICYDMRFGEMFRIMARCGARVIFVPANFTMSTGKDHWETLLRARAIENGCYIAAPGQIGRKPDYQAYGRSMVIDPWGNVVARASDREELVLAQIDTDYVAEVREQIPSLENIREDVYRLESDRVRIFGQQSPESCEN